ncbi:MAG: GNAT family N-acetyltransferase [Rhizobiales bacterium]|nr:GNAT family N-acetyltransferase [Hyphomicrobiales bacterium]
MVVLVQSLTGDDIRVVLPELAQLRMEVFRDWPYLYDGSLEYEEEYLSKFADASGAICVVAYDGEKVVGASTAAPLVEEHEEFTVPFEEAGYDISKIFYCGESVLLKEYRGRGIGHQFFDAREAEANRQGGFTHSCFCRVVRPETHPLKPDNYFALDGFWRSRGYTPVLGLIAHFEWKDIDLPNETDHQLQFWMKEFS